MSTFVFVNRLQAKDGERAALIELLREFSASIHAEPGGLHYSVHEPVGDENGPLTVIQAFSSVEAFEEHSAWMQQNIPRLASLLASPPSPPVLTESVLLQGHAKESF